MASSAMKEKRQAAGQDWEMIKLRECQRKSRGRLDAARLAVKGAESEVRSATRAIESYSNRLASAR
jgi:hypothetical protein